jgi:hypothetical protein
LTATFGDCAINNPCENCSSRMHSKHLKVHYVVRLLTYLKHAYMFWSGVKYHKVKNLQRSLFTFKFEEHNVNSIKCQVTAVVKFD